MKSCFKSLMALAVAAAFSGAHATEFRSSDVHNSDDYPTVAAVKHMSELLAKASGGKHKIKVFNKGALG
jgi:TRAP-type C4-dicarboxylate transport system substrate-binding protein